MKIKTVRMFKNNLNSSLFCSVNNYKPLSQHRMLWTCPTYHRAPYAGNDFNPNHRADKEAKKANSKLQSIKQPKEKIAALSNNQTANPTLTTEPKKQTSGYVGDHYDPDYKKNQQAKRDNAKIQASKQLEKKTVPSSNNQTANPTLTTEPKKQTSGYVGNHYDPDYKKNQQSKHDNAKIQSSKQLEKKTVPSSTGQTANPTLITEPKKQTSGYVGNNYDPNYKKNQQAKNALRAKISKGPKYDFYRRYVPTKEDLELYKFGFTRTGLPYSVQRPKKFNKVESVRFLQGLVTLPSASFRFPFGISPYGTAYSIPRYRAIKYKKIKLVKREYVLGISIQKNTEFFGKLGSNLNVRRRSEHSYQSSAINPWLKPAVTKTSGGNTLKWFSYQKRNRGQSQILARVSKALVQKHSWIFERPTPPQRNDFKAVELPARVQNGFLNFQTDQAFRQRRKAITFSRRREVGYLLTSRKAHPLVGIPPRKKVNPRRKHDIVYPGWVEVLEPKRKRQLKGDIFVKRTWAIIKHRLYAANWLAAWRRQIRKFKKPLPALSNDPVRSSRKMLDINVEKRTCIQRRYLQKFQLRGSLRYRASRLRFLPRKRRVQSGAKKIATIRRFSTVKLNLKKYKKSVTIDRKINVHKSWKSRLRSKKKAWRKKEELKTLKRAKPLKKWKKINNARKALVVKRKRKRSKNKKKKRRKIWTKKRKGQIKARRLLPRQHKVRRLLLSRQGALTSKARSKSRRRRAKKVRKKVTKTLRGRKAPRKKRSPIIFVGNRAKFLMLRPEDLTVKLKTSLQRAKLAKPLPKKKKIRKNKSRHWRKRRKTKIRRVRKVRRKIGSRYRFKRKISWPISNPRTRQLRNQNWKQGRRLRRWGKNGIAKLFFREKAILPTKTLKSLNLWTNRSTQREVLQANLPHYALHYKLKSRKWHTPRDVDGVPLRRKEISEFEKDRRISKKNIRHLEKENLKRKSWSAKTRKLRSKYRKRARSRKLRAPKFPDPSWRELELRTGYPATRGYINQRRILRNNFITNRWWRPRPADTIVRHPFSLTKVENQPKSFINSTIRPWYYTQNEFHKTEVRDYRTTGLLDARVYPASAVTNATYLPKIFVGPHSTLSPISSIVTSLKKDYQDSNRVNLQRNLQFVEEAPKTLLNYEVNSKNSLALTSIIALQAPKTEKRNLTPSAVYSKLPKNKPFLSLINRKVNTFSTADWSVVQRKRGSARLKAKYGVAKAKALQQIFKEYIWSQYPGTLKNRVRSQRLVVTKLLAALYKSPKHLSNTEVSFLNRAKCDGLIFKNIVDFDRRRNSEFYNQRRVQPKEEPLIARHSALLRKIYTKKQRLKTRHSAFLRKIGAKRRFLAPRKVSQKKRFRFRTHWTSLLRKKSSLKSRRKSSARKTHTKKRPLKVIRKILRRKRRFLTTYQGVSLRKFGSKKQIWKVRRKVYHGSSQSVNLLRSVLSPFIQRNTKAKKAKKLQKFLSAKADYTREERNLERTTRDNKVRAFKEMLRVEEFKLKPKEVTKFVPETKTNFIEITRANIYIPLTPPIFFDLKHKEMGTAYNSWIENRHIAEKNTSSVHSSLEHEEGTALTIFSLPEIRSRFPGTGSRKRSYTRAIRTYYRKVRKPRFRRASSLRHITIRVKSLLDTRLTTVKHELSTPRALRRRSVIRLSNNAFLPKAWRALSRFRTHKKSCQRQTVNEIGLTGGTKRRFARLSLVKSKKIQKGHLRQLSVNRRLAHSGYLVSILKSAIFQRKNTNAVIDGKKIIRRRRLIPEQRPPRWKRRKRARKKRRRKIKARKIIKYSKYRRRLVASWQATYGRATAVKASKRPHQSQSVSSSFENLILATNLRRKRWARLGLSRLSKSRRRRIENLGRKVAAKFYRKYPQKRKFVILKEKNDRGRKIVFQKRWHKKKRRTRRQRRNKKLQRFRDRKERRSFSHLTRLGRYKAVKRKNVKYRQVKRNLRTDLCFNFSRQVRDPRGVTDPLKSPDRAKNPRYRNDRKAKMRKVNKIKKIRKKRGQKWIKIQGKTKKVNYIDAESYVVDIAPSSEAKNCFLAVQETEALVLTPKRFSVSKKGLAPAIGHIASEFRNRLDLETADKVKNRLTAAVSDKPALNARTFLVKRARIVKKGTAVDIKDEETPIYQAYRVTTEIAEATSRFFPALISWRRKRQRENSDRTYAEAENMVLAVYWNIRFYLGQDVYKSRLVLRDNIKGQRNSRKEELEKSSITRFYGDNDRNEMRERRQAPWLRKKASQQQAAYGVLRFWFPRLYKFFLEDNDRFSKITLGVYQVQRRAPNSAAAVHWKTQPLFSLEDLSYNRLVHADRRQNTSYYENRLKTDRRTNFVNPGFAPHTKIISLAQNDIMPYSRTNFFKKGFSTRSAALTDTTAATVLRSRLGFQRQHREINEGDLSTAVSTQGHRQIKTRLRARGRLRNRAHSDERPPGALARPYARSKSPRTSEYLQRQSYSCEEVEAFSRRVTYKTLAATRIRNENFNSTFSRRTKIVQQLVRPQITNALEATRNLVAVRRKPSAVTNQYSFPHRKSIVQVKEKELCGLRRIIKKRSVATVIRSKARTFNRASPNFNSKGIAHSRADALTGRSILHYRAANHRIIPQLVKKSALRGRYTSFDYKRTPEKSFGTVGRFKMRLILLRKKNKLVYGNHNVSPKRKYRLSKFWRNLGLDRKRLDFDQLSRERRREDILRLTKPKINTFKSLRIAQSFPLQLTAHTSTENAVALQPANNLRSPQQILDLESIAALTSPVKSDKSLVDSFVRKSNSSKFAIIKAYSAAHRTETETRERNITNERRGEFWALLASRFFLKGRFLKNWVKDRKRIEIRNNWAERPERLFKDRRTRLRLYEWKESDQYFFKRGWKNAFKLYPSERQRAPWLQALRRRRTAYSTQHGEYRRYSYPREQKRVKPRQYYRKARFSVGTKRQYISFRRWPRIRTTAYRRARSLFGFRTTRAAQKHFKKLSKQKTKTTGFSRNLIGLGNRLDVNLMLLGVFKTVFWARLYSGCGLVKVNYVRVQKANHRLLPGDILHFDWGKIQKAQEIFRARRPHYKSEEFEIPLKLQALPGNFSSYPAHNHLVYDRLPYPEDIKDNTRLCRWLFDSFRRDAGIGRGSHR